jgi:hypothetical protein
MPEKETLRRAKEDKDRGKSPSTQAGEFVREEIHHVREGKHGARSAKQAIAIGLSKARRAGVKLRPDPSRTNPKTRRKAEQDMARAGQKPSAKRTRATKRALKRESRGSVSKSALARQTHSSASQRGKPARVAAAKKAARTRRMQRE